MLSGDGEHVRRSSIQVVALKFFQLALQHFPTWDLLASTCFICDLQVQGTDEKISWWSAQLSSKSSRAAGMFLCIEATRKLVRHGTADGRQPVSFELRAHVQAYLMDCPGSRKVGAAASSSWGDCWTAGEPRPCGDVGFSAALLQLVPPQVKALAYRAIHVHR